MANKVSLTLFQGGMVDVLKAAMVEYWLRLA